MKITPLKQLTKLDFLILFLLSTAIAIGLIFFSRKKSVVYVHTVSATQEWQASPFPPFYWISNSIVPGDAAYNTTGKKIAEVVDVDNVDWGGQRRYLRLKLKVFGIFDKRTKQYRLNDNPLQIGNKLKLDISSTSYEGMITYVGTTIQPPDYQYQHFRVKLKAPEVKPWLAKTYNESFRVTNSQGKEIFQIIDAVTQPAEIAVPTDQGTLVKSLHPILKDVYITAKILVRCQQRICYFNETQPVKVGVTLWMQSETSIIDNADVLQITDWNEDN